MARKSGKKFFIEQLGSFFGGTRSDADKVSGILEIGTVLDGRYRIDEPLGAGGAGTVYKGRQIQLDRPVAIKVLKGEWTCENQKARTVSMFQQEALTSCKVHHPNSITVHDVGNTDTGQPYIVMEFLEGRTLRDVVKAQAPMPLAEVFNLLQPVAAALAKAHSEGIVHRDLKPANVMVIEEGSGELWVKIVDFGIASLVAREREKADPAGLFGTPGYAAPEQWGARPVDARTDLYALGIIIYEMASGKKPFNGADLDEFRQLHCDSPVPPIEGLAESLRGPLNRFLAKALEKKPDRRFESVLEMMSEFKAIVRSDRTPESDAPPATDTEADYEAFTIEELLQVFEDAKEKFDAGEYLTAYEIIEPVIEKGLRDSRLLHLGILSLARCGATEPAIQMLERFREHLPATTEYRALGARLKKDLFLGADLSQRKELGLDALQAYARTYEDEGGFYPAINAATVAFLNDDAAEARKYGELALNALEQAEPDYWALATMAEALLLMGKDDEARPKLEAALQLPDATAASLSTTYRQLLGICDKRNSGHSVIELIEPAKAIHYTGHMINGLGASAGIDPDDVSALRQQVRDFIRKEKVGSAYGSLACGADLIVASEIIAAGQELKVVLPFPPEDFIETSVAAAGPEWVSLFRSVLDAVQPPVVISAGLGSDANLAYNLTSEVAMGKALMRARSSGGKSLQLALWNQSKARAGAGTARDVQRWADLGGTSFVVPVPLAKEISRAASPAAKSSERASPLWKTVAILFADVAGFSKLPESELVPLLDEWHERLGQLQSEFREVLLHANTWGDGYLCILRDVTQAYKFSRGLAKPLGGGRAGVRVSAHAGPAFVRYDPVQAKQVYFGASVNLAARVEPCAPRNATFATEVFAALLAAESAGQYCGQYAGIKELPKGAGHFRMYLVS